MLRSKKGSLIKRLLQHRTDPMRPDDDAPLKSAASAMLECLEVDQLKTLLDAVESRGGECSHCVRVPVCAGLLSPQSLSCRLWRWPQVTDECLKCLIWCRSSDQVCINPYHWSRLMKADSFVARNNDKQCPDGDCWCEIAYWELRDRIGRLFSVNDSYINVFADLPRGNGFCLKSTSANKLASVTEKVKNKIGFGIMISREGNGVWVYNRSDYPVFLNSHTLDPPTSRKLTVYKLSPGFSIKAFDYDKAVKYLPLQEKIQAEEGPFDPYTIRISFAKGWGPKYSRQCITNCPCWLEVMLVKR